METKRIECGGKEKCEVGTRRDNGLKVMINNDDPKEEMAVTRGI